MIERGEMIYSWPSNAGFLLASKRTDQWETIGFTASTTLEQQIFYAAFVKYLMAKIYDKKNVLYAYAHTHFGSGSVPCVLRLAERPSNFPALQILREIFKWK